MSIFSYVQVAFTCAQGWQRTDCPGKPRVKNPGFPGLGNTPRNSSTGQYLVIRYFPPVFIMQYFKTAGIVVLFCCLS